MHTVGPTICALNIAVLAARSARDEALKRSLGNEALEGVLREAMDHLFLFPLIELSLNGCTPTKGGQILIQQGLASPFLHVGQEGILRDCDFISLELTPCGQSEYEEWMLDHADTEKNWKIQEIFRNYNLMNVGDGICATAERIDRAGREADFAFLSTLRDADSGGQLFSSFELGTIGGKANSVDIDEAT